MKLNHVVYVSVLAALLALAASDAFAQSMSPASWQLTHAEVRALERSQPAAANCERLEQYYRGRAANYRQRAEEMDALLARREETAQHAGGKYVQSIDSGRHLRAYYLQMAQEMDGHAQFWDEKRQQLQ